MRKGHTDFRQSMDVDHLSDIYELIQGQGAPDRRSPTSSAAAPTSTWPPRCGRRARPSSAATTAPTTARDRRMWPAAISRGALDPFYAPRRARPARRQPAWNEVSKSGGVWAATLREAGHTCDRVPLAINLGALRRRQVVLHGLHLRRQELADHQLPGRRPSGRGRGAAAGPGERDPRSRSLRPYRYLVKAQQRSTRRPSSRAGAVTDIECKVLILAAGAMGTPPILMRSQQNGALPSLSSHLGKHLGVNGDHVAAIEYDAEPRSRDVLGLPRLRRVLQGQADHDDELRLLRRQAAATSTTAPASRCRRSCLSQLTNFLYDDGRGNGGRADLVGAREEALDLDLVAATSRSSRWSRTPTTATFYRRAAERRRLRAPERRPGRRSGSSTTTLSEQSIAGARGGQRGDPGRSSSARGLGRFLKLTETPGVYAVAPARRLPDGRLDRPRRRRPPLRGVRLRGPLLHGLLGDPDQPRGQPVADDLRGLRARRRGAGRAAADDFGLPQAADGASDAPRRPASTSASGVHPVTEPSR